MAVFKAFKPEAMNKIAKSMGYTGNMSQFQDFIEQDPARQARMQQFTNAAVQMARGGVVKMQTGGTMPNAGGFTFGVDGGFPQMPTPENPLLKGSQDARNQPINLPKLPGEKPEGYDEFLQSDIYKNMEMPTIGTADMYNSKYGLGTFGSGTRGRAVDRAYEQFLASRNQQQAAKTEAPKNVTEASIQRMLQPGLPQGGVTQVAFTPSEPGQYIDPRVGVVTGDTAVPTAMATTEQAGPVEQKQATQMDAVQAAPAVDSALDTVEAAQTDPNDPRSKVIAAEQTESSVGSLEAAQGKAHLIENPVQRKLQDGELVESTFNAEKAAAFAEQIQAAEALPSQKATIQGQLAELTSDFDGKNPPSWAAGALRNATAQMAARGLGASSIAGQALVQAAIEAALPVAQADASTFAQFESQNLSNRQQRAMLAAEQRASFIGQEFDQKFQARVLNASKISDIANQNFTAQQQVQLENARAVNTMNLNNLSNQQALVMAEAAALSELDTANLSNRQQAAVQNAQNFLQMDMANLSNRQQTDMFKVQQRVQSLFTDQAAENAARQFNATSQTQTDQFFANLASQTSQFNAAQANAQSQFNAGQVNTVERFNAEINNQRDQFNAQNQLVIAQANAQWRRQIATADTAAINRANELNANAILDMSKTAYANLWQHYADTMEWAWKSAEGELDRITNIAIAELDAEATQALAEANKSSAAKSAIGGIIGRLGVQAISTWG